MIYKAIYLICSLGLIGFSTTASATQLCGKKSQGEILVGYDPQVAKVILNNLEYSATPEGKFLIALGRDNTKNQTITLINKKGQTKSFDLEVSPVKWDIQKINGVPQKKVTPSKNDQAEIKREQTSVQQALQNGLEQNYWQQGFVQPVEGRISGEFGGQRIMNGIAKAPHQGVDVAAAEGTKIKASGDGVVTLSGGDFFYSGNMIVIDHGYNLSTIYAHMKSTNVKIGDTVTKGQIIGEVGKTGRATGAHLHWGASLNGTRFDPKSLLHMNNDNFCFNL